MHRKEKEDNNGIASWGGFCIDQWTITVQAGKIVLTFKLVIGIQGSMVPETRIRAMDAMSSTQDLKDENERWDVKLRTSVCNLIFTL